MEQHPIPQNISAYEFRLVGDMTLKQFFQLASGIIVALIIFRLPLPVFLKYPLVGLSVLTGILMAFVPVNGRPFTTWLIAFIRAIYAPTEFVWRLEEPSPPAAELTTPPPPASADAKPLGPDPSRIAKSLPVSAASAPQSLPQSVAPTQTGYLKVEQVAVVPSKTPAPNASPPPRPAPVSVAPTSETPAPPPIAQKPVPSAPSSPAPAAFTHVTPESVLPDSAKNLPPAAPTTSQIVSPALPNILAGLVTDAQGNPLEGAIVEITDSKTGIPARALRTNRLGQFQIATALSPGAYTVSVEKEGQVFEPVSVNVANSLIPPVIIKAKLASPSQEV